MVRTRLLGAAFAANVGAALAGALALLGRPASAAELEAVAAALGTVEAVPGRMRPLTIGPNAVLDDGYNSNPRSAAAALETARELAAGRGARWIAALGDMLELGAFAAAAHDELLAAAEAAGAARLILVGPELAQALDRARGAGRALPIPCSWFATSEAAAAALDALLEPGDLLLVKGSRGVRMERLIEHLERAAGGAPENLP